MKKFLSILLATVMILGLCACGEAGSEAAQEQVKGLQAGFGREVVMPEGIVHLAGTDGEGRISQGFLDYLKVTCIALRDEAGTTALIFTMDCIGASDALIDPLRTQVSEATGVPGNQIMFAATHTHSGAALTGGYDGVSEYRTIFYAGAVKAAQSAIADLSGAEISLGSTQATGLLFVRHYVHQDGKITASSGITGNSVIVGHPTEADEELQIVRLTRAAEDKKDILLLSWNSHPTFHGGVKDYLISADFPGPTRDFIESQGDYLVAYFTGDAGNQAPSSAIKEEHHGLDYKAFGEKLGQYCLDALPSLEKAEGDRIQFLNQKYPARSNKEKLDMLAQAQEVVAAKEAYGRDEANRVAARYGLYQHLEASAIVGRAQSGATRDINMDAISIGDGLSFIFAPYEMFTNHGHDIRVRTPYDMTMVVSCANGSNGYIPSQEAYDYGCYESYVSKVAPGTGEELVEEYLKMLQSLKDSQ